jgi:hypothetical protein
MGTYTSTFRSDFKKATINGETVKVYPYRFLCRPQDFSPSFWGEDKRRAALLVGRATAAEKAFERHQPKYVTYVCDDIKGHESWDRAHVWANPISASYTDSRPFPAEAIGYLKVVGRKLEIVATMDETDTIPHLPGGPITRITHWSIKDGKHHAHGQTLIQNGQQITQERLQELYAEFTVTRQQVA